MLSRLAFVEGALALAATPAVAAHNGTESTAGAARTFEPAAMTADLRAFARGVEEIGTEPFRTSSRPALMTALARAESACAQRCSEDEFYDVRRNGGGNSRVNDELFAFVTQKPYRQYGGSRTRVSERLKREYGYEKYVQYYGLEAWQKKDGDIVVWAADQLRPPRDEPGRFDGPAYLLTGTRTFSSAMACASAAKAYGLMTLTTKVWLPPEPLPENSGVVPDIVVRTTRADRRAGRDPVLETVLARLA
jgi:hypothetical protein